MSKFITGGDCNVYYENETGETTSHELESDIMYKITVQGRYTGFDADKLIFELEGQKVYISISTIKNIK